ncbi:MAG: hypothetical protein IJT26_04505 [Bacteroidales bacterium]|nr:hypothetical protein [Bacteroidales bacterium]
MKTLYSTPEIEISVLEGQKVFCASGNEDFGKGPDYGKDIFEMIPQPKPF